MSEEELKKDSTHSLDYAKERLAKSPLSFQGSYIFPLPTNSDSNSDNSSASN